MTFDKVVTLAEVGDQRTSAKGNEYLPIKLEFQGETYSLAAMGNSAAFIQSVDIGSEIKATFNVRQYKKEISLQLQSASLTEDNPFA